ncbi:MAG: hypothetical protein IPP71_19145 [Bacteroidetes bacterium]|nr:hypothetical protein [Bacteroidota bacterium]
MKKLIYRVITICNAIANFFQRNCQYNLVPNPSFELYNSCPQGLGQLTNATHWTKPITNVSPEFFHVCGTIWTEFLKINWVINWQELDWVMQV